MSESHPRRSRSRSSNRAEILAMSAALALMLVLMVGAWSAFELVSRLTDDANEATYYSSVLTRLERLSAKAADAENEQRAYMQNPDAARLKGFNDALAGIQSEYEALLKLTSQNGGAQAEIQAAKAQTDKTVDSIRDAIDY